MTVKKTCPFAGCENLEVMSHCNELPSFSELLWPALEQTKLVKPSCVHVSTWRKNQITGVRVRAEGLGWGRSFLPETPEGVEHQGGKPNVNPRGEV